MVAMLIRLRSVHGSLVLRAVPPRVARVLELTGLDTTLDVEPVNPDRALRADLTRAAGEGRHKRAVDAQLALVVAVAEATNVGADGVSVTLERNGALATVAATNETVLRMDAHQYATGEGPCLSAAHEGRPFQIEALAEEPRWPAFVPLALREGIASIFSTPLVSGTTAIGALNVYSNASGAFGSYQHELAAILAEQASRIVATDGVELTDEEMSARITGALRSRLVLAQAQGVLMARDGLTADDATDALHRSARADGCTVLERATAIVASTQRVSGG
jgi:GAF domain-containing protein